MMLGWILLLVVVVLLLTVVWWLWRHRDIGGFRSVLRQIETEMGWRDRYQLPRVLLVGAEAELCAEWGLRPGGERHWYGRWWYSGDGLVLAAPEGMLEASDGPVPILGVWHRLAGALLRARAGRPLDAVIWAVPLETLLSTEAATRAASSAEQRLSDLQQRLGLSLPVYLVVTGIERLPGVLELADKLPDAARQVMLGWSSPFALGTAWDGDWTEMALERIRETLTAVITEAGALSGSVDAALFLLPGQLESMRDGLRVLCEPVFRGNAGGEAGVFRGVYLTGTIRQGAVDEFEPDSDAHVQVTSLFAARLLRQRVLAEQGLARPLPRALALRQRGHRIAKVAMIVLALVWLGGMIWSWQGARGSLRAVTGYEARIAAASTAKAYAGDADLARQRIAAWWQVSAAVPRWHFQSVWLPTSLLSGLDNEIDAAVNRTADRYLIAPLQAGLQRQVQGLAVPAALNDAGGVSPEGWAEYQQAKRLVQQAARVDRESTLFAELRGSAPLENAAALADMLYQWKPAAKPLPSPQLSQILDGGASLPSVPLGKAKTDAGRLFSAQITAWLNRLYADDTFGQAAAGAQLQLQRLAAGQALPLAELTQLNERIALLKRLISTSDVAWRPGGRQEPVPGYSALMSEAQRVGLIDAGGVAALAQYADASRTAFTARWLSTTPGNNELLQQTAKALQLSPDASQTGDVLTALLAQDFAVSQRGLAIATVSGPAVALGYFSSYQGFLAQSDKTPLRYKAGVLASTRQLAAQAMWDATGTDGSNGFSLRTGAQQATDLSTAFDALGRHDLATGWVAKVDRIALAELRGANARVDDLALYQPLQGTFAWWDGSKNASLKAWRVSSQQDLQQYLDGQLDALAGISNGVAPAVGWLDPHADQLAMADAQLVARWRNLALQLQQYKEKSSTSAPALLNQLIGKDLNEMDIGNCATVLANAGIPRGDNVLTDRVRMLIRVAGDRCGGLRAQAAASAWEKLSAYYYQYMAGRFPFADLSSRQEADPERVGDLFRLFDDNQAIINASLQGSDAPSAPAARVFMQRLQAAKGWLQPLLAKEPGSGMTGLELDINWRTDRGQEAGADQVIAWTMAAGTQRLRYPSADKSLLRWRTGQAVSLSLRWAKDAPESPQGDAHQSGLAVADRVAQWDYTGTWSLLRLLRAHATSGLNGGDDDLSVPLLLTVPVVSEQGKISRARMFARVALQTPGGKTPLRLSPLPVSVPPSPFRAITLSQAGEPKTPQLALQ
ncbi:type VI secretion system protein [Jeongeupia wiesaeckerbachi]|uniref:type VI secretion system protein n=1 Tax=Jeongeupia wiesaeckerbachi TaxID=3051218 RepID=UPI003D803C6B